MNSSLSYDVDLSSLTDYTNATACEYHLFLHVDHDIAIKPQASKDHCICSATPPALKCLPGNLFKRHEYMDNLL